MQRLWLGMLLALVFSCTSPNLVHAQENILQQVKYEFEIYELAKNIDSHFSLSSMAVVSDDETTEQFGFKYLSDLSTVNLLGEIPTSFVGNTKKKQNFYLATPALVVVLGEMGTFRVVEEEFDSELSLSQAYFQTVGMEIQVTPQQVSDDGQIYSNFTIKTYEPTATLESQAWLKSDQVVQIAQLEVTNERVFKISVRASIVEHQPENTTHAIGGLGGLGGLLLAQAKPEIVRENYFWLSLALNKLEIPGAGLKYWISPDFFVEGEFNKSNALFSWLDLALVLFTEGPHLTLRLLDSDERYLAIGISDEVEISPGLTLVAGYLPGVWQLDNHLERQKGQWWVGVKALYMPLRLEMSYQVQGRVERFQAELGYKIGQVEPFGRVSTPKGLETKYTAGIRFTF